MDSQRGAHSFEVVKRDGRREEFSREKLARSLTRAGVAPYMLAGILDAVTPLPDQDTGSLRANIESELESWHPATARRYAATRGLKVRGSERTGFGWVCLNPETVSRLGLKPGDTAWLSDNGVPAPFSVESHDDVERGQAWLNPREMTAMGLREGAKLAASSAYHEASPLPEGPQANKRPGVTSGPLERVAG